MFPGECVNHLPYLLEQLRTAEIHQTLKCSNACYGETYEWRILQPQQISSMLIRG